MTRALPLLLLVTAFARALPAAEVRKDRPRMLVASRETAALRARCRGPGRKMFEALKRRADGMLRTPAQLDNNGRHYLPTYAFLYLVTGEETYAEKAKEWLELLSRSTIQDPWRCLAYIPVAAFAYDWIHSASTEQERKRFAAGLVRQVTRIEKLWRHSDYNNHFLLEHMSMLHVGLALALEKHHQTEWRRYLSEGGTWLERHVVPAMNEMAGADGGDAEGFSYANWGVERPLAYLLLAFRSATGEDLFPKCSFLRCASRWNVYGRKPDGRMCRSEDCPTTLTWAQLTKPTFAACGRAYRDPLAQWIFNQVPDTYPQLLWAQLLTWDPSVKAKPPGELELPLATLFRPLGHLYTRSSWDREDATWAMFQCGPIFAGHQHLDNNSFVIFKRADLAVDSGVNEYSSHRTNYYSRTVAHNSVLVFDPEEAFPNEVWSHRGSGGSNDGGQRRVDFPGRVTASAEEKALRDVGHIVAFRNRDAYAYACGDAGRSYHRGKLKHFTRQFLHLRPDTFVIFDRVVATSARYPKTWLLHSVEEPTVDAEARTFRVEHGAGRLRVWTLLPRDARLMTVGGSGREFWVNGRNHPPKEKNDPGAGSFRVEVSPGSNAKAHFFLHVLHASDRADRTDGPEVEILSEDASTVTVGIDLGSRRARLALAKKGAPGGRLTVTSGGRRLVDEELPGRIVLER